MTTFDPGALAGRLGSGLLSLPVSHFTENVTLDESSHRDNIARLAGYDVAGLFAVSIVKAGMRLTGHSAGPVRRPLTDLTDDEDAPLAEVIEFAHRRTPTLTASVGS